MIDKVSIGRIIKTIRISRRLTQEELSEKIGISKNYLSKIERGVSILNTETFLKTAEVLNFSLEDFGIRTAASSAESECRQQLIMRILSLSEKELHAYLKLLDAMQSISKFLK